MKYTKGKAGPVSRNELEIVTVHHCGSGPSAYAKGDAILTKADGSYKDVSFLVQGGNYEFHRERLVVGQTFKVPVRWTGGHAVTIVDQKTLDAYRASQAPARDAA